MTAESNATVGWTDQEVERVAQWLVFQCDHLNDWPMGVRAAAMLRAFVAERRAALSPPATTRAISDAWEILEAHVDNRRDMGHFGMAKQMQEALDVLRSALESAPATTGEVEVDHPEAMALASRLRRSMPYHTKHRPILASALGMAADKIELLIRALAAQPPSSGWEPIETAPRDGTPLMLFGRVEGATTPVSYIGWYLFDALEWIAMAFHPNRSLRTYPTHWRPLPPPPSSGEK